MPTNQTPNYKLNQWVRSDRILMEDFNADNAKIDAALKAEVDARTAADAGLSRALAKLGNCRIGLTSYVGNGVYVQGQRNIIRFDGNPLACIIGCDTALAVLFRGSNQATVLSKLDGSANVYFRDMSVAWSDRQAGLLQNNAQAMLNEKDKTYWVLAFYAMD